MDKYSFCHVYYTQTITRKPLHAKKSRFPRLNAHLVDFKLWKTLFVEKNKQKLHIKMHFEVEKP